MDSEDDSGSDDSISSSDSSGDSSSQDEERLEPARILGTTFELPQELCENPEIFKEFLSLKTWESLSEANVRHLKKFLPTFAENDEEEKEITIQKLFARETFKFTSPLVDFHRKLRDGAYRPDIARMQRVLQLAKKQHTKHQWRQEWYRTMQEVLVSRERLLTVAGGLPPGVSPRVVAPPPSLHAPAPPTIHIRTKRRYFQELAAIRSEVCGEGGAISEDENFPEGPPAPPPKHHRRHIMHLQGGDTNGIVSTMGPSRAGGPTLSEEWRRRALASHRRRKQQQPDLPEFITTGITLGSIRARCGSTNSSHPPNEQNNTGHNNSSSVRAPRRPPRRPPPPPRRPPTPPTDSNSDMDLSTPQPLPYSGDSYIKMEGVRERPQSPQLQQLVALPPQPPPPPAVVSPVTVKVENPVVEETVIPEEAGIELVQETHACFFSVLRDLVCGTPRHCLPLPALTAGLRHWRQNPIAPLNHWYSAVEDWVKALPSAVAFLAGESPSLPDDFVPYLQYKPASQVYQWIGAGRDTDSHLTQLCSQWLVHRQAPVPTPIPPTPVPQATQQLDRAPSPPNTKWTNRWHVSPTELEAFRVQERARFQRPHRAFTYRLPRGNAVVGPLKGVYASEESDGKRGARGHSLLAPGRPRHVTLLALVRDAVACLPGGEGTRAHITALLRRSQYLVPEAPEQALQAAVSGALDRMHCAPDPCVRYLPARKLWHYLHRDRTEEEFERLHAEVQGQGKGAKAGGTSATAAASGKRPSSARPRARSTKKSNEGQNNTSTNAVAISSAVNSSIDSDGDGEDANVDVEGTEPSIPELFRPEPRQEINPVRQEVVKHEPIRQEIVKQEPIRQEIIKQEPAKPVQQIAASPAPASLLQTDKINVAVSSISGTSLLQPRSSVMTSSVVRQGAVGGRSVVRVLNSSASGKSLISPQALRPSTPPPSGPRPVQTQAKVVVQRPQVQSTGALSPAHQRILLESLMHHQRTHGQPMSHDQLLHTIHSTQKLSSSPPVTPGSSPVPPKSQPTTMGQTIQLAGQTVQLASGQTVQLAGQTVQLTGQTVQLGGQTVQLAGQTVQLGGGQTVQLGGQTVQLGGGQTVQLGGGQTMQLGGQTVQLSSGQTVQLTGQTVQLGSGQTVQLGSGQTVQLGGGQTMQLGGQTVQLGNGQTVQIASGQTVTRPAGEGALRATTQRQTTPLVAKILTNAQVRGGSIVTSSRMATPTGSGALRVSGLSLAQLQGKPVLLHTSSSNSTNSNILLQASGGSVSSQGMSVNNSDTTGNQRVTPTTAQHTLLLSNIVSSGGQVVRVASGGGHLLGPALRLQAASPSTPVQGRVGNTGVMLGGQALKLQASPIRLHQGAVSGTNSPGTGRVILASGARLHGLKLLPVHQTLSRGGGTVGGRQVYARIVGPAVSTASPAASTVVRAVTPAAPTTPNTNPATTRNH